MKPDYKTLLNTLKTLNFLSQVSRRSKIPNELQALEAHAKQLYADYLEKEQWPQVTLTIDTISPLLQRAFMRAYSDVRIGQPTHWFPSIEGTWWAWPPPPPALHALDPSGGLKSVALPEASKYSPEDLEEYEKNLKSRYYFDRI